MENKGLCLTCVFDKKCIFFRKFPVLQCEEFSDYEPIAKKINSTVNHSGQQKKFSVAEETTEFYLE